MRPSRIAALVMGCLLVIPAIALLFGGRALGSGYALGRDDDGNFDTTPGVDLTGGGNEPPPTRDTTPSEVRARQEISS